MAGAGTSLPDDDISMLTHLCSIVETATTVVCPYASVSTQSGGVVTSLIQTTTYVRTTQALQAALTSRRKGYEYEHEAVASLQKPRG